MAEFGQSSDDDGIGMAIVEHGVEGLTDAGGKAGDFGGGTAGGKCGVRSAELDAA